MYRHMVGIQRINMYIALMDLGGVAGMLIIFMFNHSSHTLWYIIITLSIFKTSSCNHTSQLIEYVINDKFMNIY